MPIVTSLDPLLLEPVGEGKSGYRLISCWASSSTRSRSVSLSPSTLMLIDVVIFMTPIGIRSRGVMRALIDLRGRPPGKAIVRIRLTGTRRGKPATVKRTRVFRTCAAKRAATAAGLP